MVPDCDACYNTTLCLVCINNSIIINGDCFSILGCVSYNSTTCLSCLSGLDLINNACLNCSLAYVSSISNTSYLSLCFANQSCAGLGPHCSICYNASLCLFCSNGSLFNGNCIFISGCSSYSGSSCMACETNLKLHNNTCINCSLSHIQSISNASLNLEQILNCYGNDTNCSSSNPHCDACYNATFCLSCTNNTNLVNGSCFSILGCISYNMTTCLICNSGLDLINNACLNCSLAYATSITNTSHLSLCFMNRSCSSLGPHCSICYNSSICLFCANGSLFNG